jgi:hypothetical protein
MKLRNRMIAASVTIVMGATLFMPVAAQASNEGKRNTAIALAAAAALLLLSQNHRSTNYSYDRYDSGRDCDQYGYPVGRNDRYNTRIEYRYDNGRYGNSRYDNSRYDYNRNDRGHNDRYDNSRHDNNRDGGGRRR